MKELDFNNSREKVSLPARRVEDLEVVNTQKMIEKLRLLDLPMGNEDLMESVVDFHISNNEDENYNVRPNMVFYSITKDQKSDLEKLLYVFFAESNSPEFIAAKTFLNNHLSKQKNAISKIAFIELFLCFLLDFVETDKSFTLKTIQWRFSNVDEVKLSVLNQLKSVISLIGDYIFTKERKLNGLRIIVSTLNGLKMDFLHDVIHEYLLCSNDICEFSKRLTDLVFIYGDSADFIHTIKRRLVYLFDTALGTTLHNRVRYDLSLCKSEDLYFLFERYAGDYYPELHDEHKELILSAAMEPFEF